MAGFDIAHFVLHVKVEKADQESLRQKADNQRQRHDGIENADLRPLLRFAKSSAHRCQPISTCVVCYRFDWAATVRRSGTSFRKHAGFTLVPGRVHDR